MAGNLERGAVPTAHTNAGFQGYEIDGVGLGGGEILDLLTDNGHRYVIEDQSVPNRKNVSLIPTGPVELGRFTLDATLASFDTPVIAPILPQHLAVVVEAVYMHAVTIAGLTSDPVFNLGTNTPNFNDVLAGIDLSVGAGIAQGEVRKHGFADGADVREVAPGETLTLRLATPAVATTYSVQVIVFGRVVQP